MGERVLYFDLFVSRVTEKTEKKLPAFFFVEKEMLKI